MRSLLLKSADLRLTAAGAQKHDWLREAEDLSQTPRKDSTFREEVTRSLLSFRWEKFEGGLYLVLSATGPVGQVIVVCKLLTSFSTTVAPIVVNLL